MFSTPLGLLLRVQTAWPAQAVLAFSLLCTGAGLARAADATDAGAGASLRASFVALQDRLEHNAFDRPLYLNSSEGSGVVRGDIHAVIASPFDEAGVVLGTAGEWCGILMLHLNTKDCRVSKAAPRTVLNLWIGSKYDQPLSDASRLDFSYNVRAQTATYLQVRLSADEGPMGTRDYRIDLEAIPLPNGRTFLHLGYSYGYGMLARLAMQAYLATNGKDKVGFSVVGLQSDNPPHFIGGLRGVIERNTMRYYLAIETFLGALSTAPQARFEKRIRDWYMAAERYSRQLHEIDSAEYLAMKRKENLRAPADPA